MRISLAFVIMMFTAACSGGGGGGASAPLDASVDAQSDGASGVPCSAQIESPRGPSYVCGTCANDGIYVPKCVNEVLVCTAPAPSNLVQCECGVLGLNTGCCDECGQRAGSFSCTASGAWECPTGLTTCGQHPVQCVDGGGADASDGTNAADARDGEGG